MLKVMVHEERLSDGSVVYNVEISGQNEFQGGLEKLTLAAMSERDAYKFIHGFKQLVNDYTVDGVS